jgi:hypothetical protein
LRNYQSLKESRNSPHFMEPVGLLPRSLALILSQINPVHASIQFILRSTLILSCHQYLGRPNGLLLSGFLYSTNKPYTMLLSYCHFKLILFAALMSDTQEISKSSSEKRNCHTSRPKRTDADALQACCLELDGIAGAWLREGGHRSRLGKFLFVS